MKHFSIREYTFSQTADRRGIDNTLKTQQLLDNANMTLAFMELVRRVCGDRPIFISSGYRCPELNSKLRGSSTSQHKQAEACDFLVSRLSPKDACKAIISSGLSFDQLIYEGRWTHISTTKNPRGISLTASFGPDGVNYMDGIV